jgi:hypothetical protein
MKKVFISLFFTCILQALLFNSINGQHVIRDFQVNENAGDADQTAPSVTIDGRGYIIFTWQDFRNGEPDIYTQRFSDELIPLGDDFRVNDDEGNGDQFSPVVVSDENGNFVITWEDQRNKQAEIYAQRFSPDGTKLGGNFLVHDRNNCSHFEPDISFNDNGDFIITWRNIRYEGWNEFNDIYTQRFSNYGTRIGEAIVVEGANDVRSVSPCITADGLGNFIIAYVFNNGTDLGDIYARRFSGDGDPIGSTFKVNFDETNITQSNPVIDSDKNGNFIISWKDILDDKNNIYAQRFFNDGNPIGDNFKVNDNSAEIKWQKHCISVNSVGNFIIIWTDYRNGNFDIYAQRYSAEGIASGNNFLVNESIAEEWQERSAVAMDLDANLIIAWADGRNRNKDIYAQKFSNNGSAVKNNFQVNCSEGSAAQRNPAIAVDKSGNFIVCWADYRDIGDIYAQMFSADGIPKGNNFIVNDEGPIQHKVPSITVDGSGNFIITWFGGRTDKDILAQRFSADGTRLGDNFIVDDDTTHSYKWWPYVSANSLGNFVVAWGDERNGNTDVYAQCFSSDGTALGSNFRVNDDESVGWQSLPIIATEKSGNFIISWPDQRSGRRIYAQRYLKDGTKLGANFSAIDEYVWGQSMPYISIDVEGNFVIAWIDYRFGVSDIYGQLFLKDATKVGENFKINDTDFSAYENMRPSVSKQTNGNFVVVWTDERHGDRDIYGQRYSTDGQRMGENFHVTSAGNKLEAEPDVKLWNNRIYTTWADNRAGETGYDIWVNILDFEDPTVNVKIPKVNQIPTQPVLLQNYPNPFNVSTVISYQLSCDCYVELTIYSITGQKIFTLVSEQQQAGNHKFEYDGGDSASGVYFYRLVAESPLARSSNKLELAGQGFVQTKKLILLK